MFQSLASWIRLDLLQCVLAWVWITSRLSLQAYRLPSCAFGNPTVVVGKARRWVPLNGAVSDQQLEWLKDISEMRVICCVMWWQLMFPMTGIDSKPKSLTSLLNFASAGALLYWNRTGILCCASCRLARARNSAGTPPDQTYPFPYHVRMMFLGTIGSDFGLAEQFLYRNSWYSCDMLRGSIAAANQHSSIGIEFANVYKNLNTQTNNHTYEIMWARITTCFLNAANKNQDELRN